MLEIRIHTACMTLKKKRKKEKSSLEIINFNPKLQPSPSGYERQIIKVHYLTIKSLIHKKQIIKGESHGNNKAI